MDGCGPGKAGRGLTRNGKTLLSGVDPSGRADKTADALTVKERTLYFCPSPLYGYGLERLLARLETQAPGSAVLCVEADPELLELSQKHFNPVLKNNPKLRLTGIREAGPLCAFLRGEWGARVFRRVETIRFNGGWQLFPEVYDNLVETLRREIAIDWGNALTLTRLGRRYIRNAVRNLALIPNHPSLDKMFFGDAPVLVLGAGPSLDGFLDALANKFGETLDTPEKRPFRIICVDTCLLSLKARNIKPDLAVILESQHWNLGDFIGLSGWDVPAAMDLSALPRSGEVLSGGLSLFFTPWTELSVFKRLKEAGLLPVKIPPMGSVGLTAVAIALEISAGPVITAGLDFSFTADSFHARSTPGHLSKLYGHNRFNSLFNADTVYGGTAFKTVSKTGGSVLSSPALTHYRNLFERNFGGNGGSGRLFDITGSGLPLGLKTLPANEAVSVLGNGGAAKPQWESGIGEWGCGKAAMGSGEWGRRCASESVLAEKLRVFALNELARLTLLKDILTGVKQSDSKTLDTLIEECDYFWAHFPDYAASSRRPCAAELETGNPDIISFLNRLRVETEPFLALFQRLCG